MSILGDKTIDALHLSLNLRSINQNIISSNITNAETPNYKSKVLDFDKEFQRYIGQTRENNGAMELEPTIGEDPTTVANRDGNSVNLDKELSRLAKNSIMFNASSQILTSKLKLLRYAIQGGRG